MGANFLVLSHLVSRTSESAAHLSDYLSAVTSDGVGAATLYDGFFTYCQMLLHEGVLHFHATLETLNVSHVLIADASMLSKVLYAYSSLANSANSLSLGTLCVVGLEPCIHRPLRTTLIFAHESEAFQQLHGVPWERSSSDIILALKGTALRGTVLHLPSIKTTRAERFFAFLASGRIRSENVTTQLASY